MYNNWSLQNLKTEDKLVIIFLIGLILTVFSIIFVNNRSSKIRTDEIKHQIVENPLEKVKITAKAGIVWDMKERKIIFSQNADAVLPLASITKAMAALTAIDLIPEYTTVTINKDSLSEEGDTGLFVDENWKLKDLLDMSLVTSSNDGVRAIASVAGAVINTEVISQDTSTTLERLKFIDGMNKKAKSIGLTNTHFENENGLDLNLVESGAYGTVEDVALMFDYILRNHDSLLESTRNPVMTIRSLNNIDHNISNTNIVVNSLPGLLGSKTGFTDLAGGNLAIVTDIGLEGPYIIAVLGSTEESRFTDIEALVKATREYVVNVK